MLGRTWLADRKRPSRSGRIVRLARDGRGSALVEFGLAAPIFILIVMGIVEFGTVMFVNSLMEGAVRDASRYGITGQDGANRAQNIRDLVAERTLGLVDIDLADIKTRVYDRFADIGYTEPVIELPPEGEEMVAGVHFEDLNDNGVWEEDLGREGAGDADEIVLYTIDYDLPLLTGVLGHLVGHDDHVGLQASVAVRNEPFYENH